MNTFLFCITFATILATTQTYHLSRNQFQQNILAHSQHAAPSRTLSQLPQEKQYTMRLVGLKYAGLFIYSIGLRIAGMENLFVWQSVQIYQQVKQQTKNFYFQVGEFINGYTNPALFALQGFGYGFLFEKLNLVWEVCLLLFLVAIILKHIVAPWYKTKLLKIKQNQIKVQNQISPQNHQLQMTEQTEINLLDQKPTTKQIYSSRMTAQKYHQGTESTMKLSDKIIQSNLSKEDLKFSQQKSKCEDLRISSLQTAAGSNLRQSKSQYKNGGALLNKTTNSTIQKTENALVREHPLISQDQSSDGIKHSKTHKKLRKQEIRGVYKKYKQVILYSNVMLKQGVFYILINSLPILGFSTILQLQNRTTRQLSLTNLSFSTCAILGSSLVMFLYTFRLVLDKGKGSGQTRHKFSAQSYANKIYWIVTIVERIVYSVMMGSGWNYGIAFVCSLKLVLLIMAKFTNLWAKSSDYYRHLVTNFIHLLILIVLVLDEFYFSSDKKIDLSKTSVAFILLSLIALSFLLNFIFILKDVGIFSHLSKCFKIGISKVGNCSVAQNQNATNKNIQNQTNHSRHVKFEQNEPRSTIQPSTKSQNSIKKVQNSMVNSSIKLQKMRQSKKINSHQNKANNFSIFKKGERSLNLVQKNANTYAKSEKKISKVVNDAVRAQNTHHMIHEEAGEREQSQSQDADMVSIQLKSVVKNK